MIHILRHKGMGEVGVGQNMTIDHSLKGGGLQLYDSMTLRTKMYIY